jgi:UPF0755 protein
MDEPLLYIQEPSPVPLLPAPKWWHHFSLRGSVWYACFAVGFCVFLATLGFIASAPRSFPVGGLYTVSNGETLSGAAAGLEKAHIVRSPLMFKVLLTLFGGTRGLSAGDYAMSERQGVVTVAWRLAHGEYDLENVRVTIPEGFSSIDIADRLAPLFPKFKVKEFLARSAVYEGYLFPDTYLFPPNVTVEQVITTMTDTYQRRIVSLAGPIAAFKKPIKDVVTMASIIEEEARTEESRRMIAGILWKRLSIGMPLQVDAAFAFVNGKKASSDLTLDDLKIDSPYNTYVNKGLPPGPISNPGLDSILATVTPIPSQYFFYLTDKSGAMRYAVTHDEHVANKNKYLR